MHILPPLDELATYTDDSSIAVPTPSSQCPAEEPDYFRERRLRWFSSTTEMACSSTANRS